MAVVLAVPLSPFLARTTALLMPLVNNNNLLNHSLAKAIGNYKGQVSPFLVRGLQFPALGSVSLEKVTVGVS